MTKKLFILTLIGLISATSSYAACNGGTEITNTAGTTFCKSNVEMNWWSAAAWCKENGLHLATMYEMCPTWDGNTGDGKCPELNGKGSDRVWSATARGSEYAFYVTLSNGNVRDDATRNYSSLSAFCRQRIVYSYLKQSALLSKERALA